MKRNESKYKQVVNHVIEGINNGSYKKGDWILSILSLIHISEPTRP